jgi:hypothetical protein
MFQAMAAAGKDGAIKHVMSGVNPQRCQVFSFKAPTSEDLDHDYLWRCIKSLPERGAQLGSTGGIGYGSFVVRRGRRESGRVSHFVVCNSRSACSMRTGGYGRDDGI